ncbi:MAG: hypothetical protein CMM02_21445 [Rhodopirellula sp.]|jgi:hypothetical protein|nr:hypothetical protein [Rhodopirellula sp.]
MADVIENKDKRYRTTTDLEKSIFSYLDTVRESGIMNMGNGAQLVRETFGLERKEARFVSNLWMKNHNRDGNYEIIRVDGLC